jgi:hypothetical protein
MARGAISKQQHAALAKDEKAELELWRGQFRSVMSTKAGRAVVWGFLSRAQVFGSAFNTNAMQQSHNIGWQDAGKWWLAEIEQACPEQYQVMANEARAERERLAAIEKRNETEDTEQ